MKASSTRRRKPELWMQLVPNYVYHSTKCSAQNKTATAYVFKILLQYEICSVNRPRMRSAAHVALVVGGEQKMRKSGGKEYLKNISADDGILLKQSLQNV